MSSRYSEVEHAPPTACSWQRSLSLLVVFIVIMVIWVFTCFYYCSHGHWSFQSRTASVVAAQIQVVQWQDLFRRFSRFVRVGAYLGPANASITLTSALNHRIHLMARLFLHVLHVRSGVVWVLQVEAYYPHLCFQSSLHVFPTPLQPENTVFTKDMVMKITGEFGLCNVANVMYSHQLTTNSIRTGMLSLAVCVLCKLFVFEVAGLQASLTHSCVQAKN